MTIDQPSVRAATVAAEDTSGAPFAVTGVVIPVIISDEEAASLLAAYDSDNAYSPDAATSRSIARAVLDALKAHSG
tara:strand:- start:1298 stop:1525 length:228 start_codon:yes stop_codon:yes gene_type:complete